MCECAEIASLTFCSYIFSDKTGTLTRNEMEFKRCCVGGKTFGLMGDEAKNVAPLKSGETVPGYFLFTSS